MSLSVEASSKYALQNQLLSTPPMQDIFNKFLKVIKVALRSLCAQQAAGLVPRQKSSLSGRLTIGGALKYLGIPVLETNGPKDPPLFDLHIQAARACDNTHKDYSSALSDYQIALKYTDDWRAYTELYQFFMKYERTGEAFITCLFQAERQVRTKHVLQALDSIELARSCAKQIKYYIFSESDLNAVTTPLLKNAIQANPSDWDFYRKLVRILENPVEKMTWALKAIDRSIEVEDLQIAEEFLKKAKMLELSGYEKQIVALESKIHSQKENSSEKKAVSANSSTFNN